MVAGVLGCPICQVEHEVRGGVLHWAAAASAGAASDFDANGAAPFAAPMLPVDSNEIARVGALLGFGEATAPFVLTGQAADTATGLLGIADAALVLLDPPDDTPAAFTTVIRGAPKVPLAARSTRGVLLEGGWARTAQALAVVETLVDGGRLVAPVSVAVPAGVRELARDARQWVAERVGGGVPIPLRRATR
jgi:hypothetical protein